MHAVDVRFPLILRLVLVVALHSLRAFQARAARDAASKSENWDVQGLEKPPSKKSKLHAQWG